MGKFPVVKDAIERILATFVATVLGLATADGVNLQSVLSVDNWKTWGVAGLVAAFTLLKTIIASRFGGKGASAMPGVELAPEKTPTLDR